MCDYKVVYRADRLQSAASREIEWECGCPVLFDAIQVSRDTETGEAFLQARVMNICPVVVTSFEAQFTCRYRDSSEEVLRINPLDADIASGDFYTMQPIELRQGDIREVRAVICSVLGPSSEWLSSSMPVEYPNRTELRLSEAAVAERALQLRERGCEEYSTAALFPVEEHGDWTLCACGQVNVGLDRCVSCGLSPLRAEREIENEPSLMELAGARATKKEAEREEEKGKREAFKEGARKAVPYIGIVAAVIVAFMVFVFRGCGQSSLIGRNLEIHTPTIEELEEGANSITGGQFSFTENYDYDDSYHMLFDEEPVGSVYFDVGSSERVGIYVERDSDVDDAEAVFAQIACGAIIANNQKLSLDDAKSILSDAVDEGVEYEDGVQYKFTESDERYIIRIGFEE